MYLQRLKHSSWYSQRLRLSLGNWDRWQSLAITGSASFCSIVCRALCLLGFESISRLACPRSLHPSCLQLSISARVCCSTLKHLYPILHWIDFESILCEVEQILWGSSLRFKPFEFVKSSDLTSSQWSCYSTDLSYFSPASTNWGNDSLSSSTIIFWCLLHYSSLINFFWAKQSNSQLYLLSFVKIEMAPGFLLSEY